MHNYHIHTTTIKWHLPSGRSVFLTHVQIDLFLSSHTSLKYIPGKVFFDVCLCFFELSWLIFLWKIFHRDPFQTYVSACHKTPTHFSPFCPKGSFSSFHTENAPAGCLHCHNPLPDPAQKTMTSCTPRGRFLFSAHTNTIHSFISFVS